MQSAVRANIVIRQCAIVFQGLICENQTLLIVRDAFFVLDILLRRLMLASMCCDRHALMARRAFGEV